MSLGPGARLGPYEIRSVLGVGGMGEVYRARDTRLQRDVALKILPESLTSDPDRLARFEREAQVLATLNHPNIAAIHHVQETAEGRSAIVMELVEGETLANQISRGAIPLEEALPIARQIAESLEAAHEKGIIHRDLKPANIKIRADGTVKVLDFGLAKAFELPSAMGPDATLSPTITSPAMMTGIGVLLGTAAYMAPEQASGKPVDKRADVWSFGVTLWEMLVGRRLFDGETVSDTLADILRSPIDFTRLPAETPGAIRELLRRCLNRDGRKRLRDIGEARIQLDDLLSGVSSEAGSPAAAVVPPDGLVKSARFAWSIAALVLVAAVALAISSMRYAGERTLKAVQTRFDVQTPPTSDSDSFALSADGRRLAFVATTEGAPRLWVRSLDQVTPRVLPGTDGATYPFWAPDGTAIGFFADGRLKRVDLAGGMPQTLAEAQTARGGTWNRDGIIVFAGRALLGDPLAMLTRVAATGGDATPVTHLSAGHTSHRWPQFLPDGRRFLFFVTSDRPDVQGVYLGSLEGAEPTRVLAADTAALFAPPDFLLLVHQDALVAIRFDPVRGTVSGDTVPVAQSVGADTAVFRGAFTVSAGVLAHRAGGSQRRQLVWVNRSGKVLSTVGSPDEAALSTPEMAPDGRRVAVNRNVGGNYDIWTIDVGRAVASRFTFDRAADFVAVWSADGRRVAFSSTRNGVRDLFEKSSNGVGDETPLLSTEEGKVPLSWSSDGQYLLYASQNPNTGGDLWALPMAGGRKPFPIVRTPFDEAEGQFSPDGRWVAYQSNASGSTEIYVRPFPKAGGEWQVSTSGGTQPRWRLDGKELFYVAADGRLMAAPIAAGTDRQTLDPGAPMPLFQTRLATGANIPLGALSTAQYAVASDGRFLMNVAVNDTTASPITVVLNWDAEMTR